MSVKTFIRKWKQMSLQFVKRLDCFQEADVFSVQCNLVFVEKCLVNVDPSSLSMRKELIAFSFSLFYD